MTEIEMKIEALRRCVSQQAFEEAMEELRNGNSPAEGLDLHEQILQALLDLGVPAHLAGHAYLVRGIEMLVENPKLVRSATKVIYPAIADELDTTPARVERGMRHAIEVAWKRADLDVQYLYFGYTVSPDKGKPTNSEFLAQTAAAIRQRTQPHT